MITTRVGPHLVGAVMLDGRVTAVAASRGGVPLQAPDVPHMPGDRWIVTLEARAGEDSTVLSFPPGSLVEVMDRDEGDVFEWVSVNAVQVGDRLALGEVESIRETAKRRHFTVKLHGSGKVETRVTWWEDRGRRIVRFI